MEPVYPLYTSNEPLRAGAVRRACESLSNLKVELALHVRPQDAPSARYMLERHSTPWSWFGVHEVIVISYCVEPYMPAEITWFLVNAAFPIYQPGGVLVGHTGNEPALPSGSEITGREPRLGGQKAHMPADLIDWAGIAASMHETARRFEDELIRASFMGIDPANPPYVNQETGRLTTESLTDAMRDLTLRVASQRTDNIIIAGEGQGESVVEAIRRQHPTIEPYQPTDQAHSLWEQMRGIAAGSLFGRRVYPVGSIMLIHPNTEGIIRQALAAYGVEADFDVRTTDQIGESEVYILPTVPPTLASAVGSLMSGSNGRLLYGLLADPDGDPDLADSAEAIIRAAGVAVDSLAMPFEALRSAMVDISNSFMAGVDWSGLYEAVSTVVQAFDQMQIDAAPPAHPLEPPHQRARHSNRLEFHRGRRYGLNMSNRPIITRRERNK